MWQQPGAFWSTTSHTGRPKSIFVAIKAAEFDSLFITEAESGQMHR